MKLLNIHPRLLSFFGLILTLNLLISIRTQYTKEYASSWEWLLNLTFPLWFAVVAAFPIGIILFFIPQDESDFTRKMLRSQLFGVMVVSFILFVMYLYQIMAAQELRR
ncbi:MAG TPA: hypothetical protein DIW47_11330 [Bacteroidetes bacterium]|nr:hypothetical protein [Bacteroidota bacterium]